MLYFSRFLYSVADGTRFIMGRDRQHISAPSETEITVKYGAIYLLTQGQRAQRGVAQKGYFHCVIC